MRSVPFTMRKAWVSSTASCAGLQHQSQTVSIGLMTSRLLRSSVTSHAPRFRHSNTYLVRSHQRDPRCRSLQETRTSARLPSSTTNLLPGLRQSSPGAALSPFEPAHRAAHAPRLLRSTPPINLALDSCILVITFLLDRHANILKILVCACSSASPQYRVLANHGRISSVLCVCSALCSHACLWNGMKSRLIDAICVARNTLDIRLILDCLYKQH